MPVFAALRRGRRKGDILFVEGIIAGGVWGVAESSPAADLHIVEVVFARAGGWDEVKGIF